MPSHRSTYPIALLVLVFAGGCDLAGTTIITKLAGPKLTGSGVLKSETREVGAFNAIKTSGAIQSVITIGNEPSIEISAEDNIVPVLRTEVKNGVLHIDIEHQGSLSVTKPITATIVTPSLVSIDLDGACSAEASGVESENFTLDLDGSSRVTLDGVFGQLDADIDGASKLTVSGSCKKLTADMDGASHLRSLKLVTQIAKLETDGASSARVHVTDKLTADSNGASSVRYTGQPTDLQVSKSGAASIKPLEN